MFDRGFNRFGVAAEELDVRHQVVDLRSGPLMHDLGDAAAVAMAGVAVEAEQAYALAGAHDREQFVHRLDRIVGFQMLVVEAPQRIQPSGTRRVSPVAISSTQMS